MCKEKRKGLKLKEDIVCNWLLSNVISALFHPTVKYVLHKPLKV